MAETIISFLCDIGPSYLLIAIAICALAVFCLILSIKHGRDARAMRSLNKRYSATSTFDGVITIQKKLKSLQAFNQFSARAEAERYIESNQEFFSTIMERNSQKEQDYSAYHSEYLAIYRRPKGLLRYWKRRYIKSLKKPLVDGYKIHVQYSYTSPAGRNHYSNEYSYPWSQVQKYAAWLRHPMHRYSPEQFLRKDLHLDDFAGVYVLRNKRTNRCYVGQAQSLKTRIKQHFTGRGCMDVYTDWRNGEPFEITLHSLEHSYFENLNDMERHYITKFNAYDGGYNKTQGNR